MYPPYISPTSPLRSNVLRAYSRAVNARHPKALIIPQMSSGATDGTPLRMAGIPLYGVDGIWFIAPKDDRAHGINERIPVKAFIEDIDHWHDMVADLAG